MQILIIKDSATKTPREVADLAEARAISNGMAVEVLCEDGVWRDLAALEVADEQPADEPTLTAAPAKKAAAKKAR